MHDPRVFICYSRRGHGPKWKAALLRALHVFEQHHLLDVWHDGNIRMSSYFDDDIKQAIASARVAVVLLTPEALESEYIRNTEFPLLRARQCQDKLPVFPVICEPCSWREHDWLRATQAPNESSPFCQLSKADQELTFRRLGTAIADAVSSVALSGLPTSGQPPPPSHVYLEKFPLTRGPGLREERLIGREQELALLDLAFAQPQTAIVSLVAWGGVGKTMLVQHWLLRLQREGWFGAQRVYAWSFHSQGTKEDRQAPEDTFLAHALEWFGVQCEPTLSPWDKGRLLADAIARERTLLILDGIEPLQYPPGPMGGQLRAPGVQGLLKQLARSANFQPKTRNPEASNSLCLVTTREPLTDLAEFQRREGSPWGSVLRVDLGNLTDEAGAALLHHSGANRAGAAEIKPDDKELLAATCEVGGHALTVTLLGHFLAHAHGGDIRRRDLVKFDDADRVRQGGTTFKMLAAFENWFNRSGDTYKQQLAVLRILGLFNRPADVDCITALRHSPAIAGLTDPLFRSTGGFLGLGKRHVPISDEEWNNATHFLEDFGLITIHPDTSSCVALLDCHPLVREYFSKRIREQSLESFRCGHDRVCSRLLGTTEARPSTVRGLEPLYHAITHGCLAGRSQEMVGDVYQDRINRGTHAGGFYSTRVLGAYSLDLSAVAAFFSEPWKTVTPTITRADQSWVTYAAGFLLRASGRLEEAIEPMRLGAGLAEADGDWPNAAIRMCNLSQALQLLGRIQEAVQSADEAVRFARRSHMADQVMYRVAAAGDSLHQRGDVQDAKARFEEAEAIQATYGGSAYLGSMQGHLYCELIMRDAERAAWSAILGVPLASGAIHAAATICEDVIKRARATFDYDKQNGMGALSLALSLLSMARAAIYYWTLVPSARTDEPAMIVEIVDDAFSAMKQANVAQHLPPILMSRAMFSFSRGSIDAAAADLDDAWDIAERGPMRLQMADIYLHRARLFFRETHYRWKSPQDDLGAAERLINDCGYHRRDGELADAQRAILKS